MEAHFATMFEDVRHEQLLILLLSLPDPDKLKQSKITDHEITVIKNFALEKYTVEGYWKKKLLYL